MRECMAFPTRVTGLPTPFGPVHLFWTDRGSKPVVTRILLHGDVRSAARRQAMQATGGRGEIPGEISQLLAEIRAFLAGRDIAFGTGLLDLDNCPPFQRRVLLAERAIPRGYISTYGRIARHLGMPGGARAVGNALANNPFPIAIPCHRALRWDGHPGGFQGGRTMKVRLLAMEGIRFRPDGRAVMDRVFY